MKLGKLLWDALGSEFGGRHELYEINYAGSTEEIRRYCLFGAQASGAADRFKGFAEQCMAEYDLDGWKSPDLMDPGALSYHAKRGVSKRCELHHGDDCRGALTRRKTDQVTSAVSSAYLCASITPQLPSLRKLTFAASARIRSLYAGESHPSLISCVRPLLDLALIVLLVLVQRLHLFRGQRKLGSRDAAEERRVLPAPAPQREAKDSESAAPPARSARRSDTPAHRRRDSVRHLSDFRSHPARARIRRCRCRCRR